MLTLIHPYVPLTLSLLWLLAAWCFGDWRNWKDYYPSILFTSVISLVVFTLTHNYPLWKFHSAFLFPSRTSQEYRVDFTVLPSISFLFLTFYHKKLTILKQFLYITYWVVFLSVVESFLGFSKLLTYHNGWNIWWSVAFWYVALVVIRLHHARSQWALLVSLVLIISGVIYFKVPLHHLD